VAPLIIFSPTAEESSWRDNCFNTHHTSGICPGTRPLLWSRI